MVPGLQARHHLDSNNSATTTFHLKIKIMSIVLELKGVTKAFPGVLANDNVNLTLKEGEVHALLGENGAGKTTLMNILYGLYTPDSGKILIRGAEVEINSPDDAIEHGIGMVHQHFMLIPVFSVADNIMLGVESIRGGIFLDRETVTEKVREISSNFGLPVDPEALVEDLSVGEEQRVEIIKVLYREAEILILDEPTAVLTPQESEELFKVIRSLVKRGKSIIFISHKLKEVLAIADRITVLRRGKLVGTTTPKEATEESLAEMMVGREVVLRMDKGKAKLGKPVLEVDHLYVKDDRNLPAVTNLSFEVRGGEVLGIAGVQGNGQTELVEALTGLRKVESGSIHINGEDTTNFSPREIHEAGIAHIPEDRQREGLILSFPIADNLIMNSYYKPPFAKGISLQPGEIEKEARKRVELFDIRTPRIDIPASTLSGGNQQKVIVAREFSHDVNLLIASQPTRGLDVGSIEYIHRRIIEKRDNGAGVLLISPELDEILSLSDRVAVMFEGEIVEILAIEDATREKVGLLMAGIQTAE